MSGLGLVGGGGGIVGGSRCCGACCAPIVGAVSINGPAHVGGFLRDPAPGMGTLALNTNGVFGFGDFALLLPLLFDRADPFRDCGLLPPVVR